MDVTDFAAAARGRLRRFAESGVTTVEDPAVRAAWHRGRTDFAVFVLRVGSPALRDRVRRIAEALDDLVSPTPDDDLHVTVHVAGFVGTPAAVEASAGGVPDDVPHERLRSMLARTAAHGRRIRLVAHGAGAFAAAPYVEIEDRFGDLASVRASLEAMSPELRFAPYVPHVTVGLFARPTRCAHVAERLEPLAKLPPITLELGPVECVTLDARDPSSRLRTYPGTPR